MESKNYVQVIHFFSKQATPLSTNYHARPRNNFKNSIMKYCPILLWNFIGTAIPLWILNFHIPSPQGLWWKNSFQASDRRVPDQRATMEHLTEVLGGFWGEVLVWGLCLLTEWKVKIMFKWFIFSETSHVNITNYRLTPFFRAMKQSGGDWWIWTINIKTGWL